MGFKLEDPVNSAKSNPVPGLRPEEINLPFVVGSFTSLERVMANIIATAIRKLTTISGIPIFVNCELVRILVRKISELKSTDRLTDTPGDPCRL